MGFMKNKSILITGILSNRSIAYGIAKSMYREGARLAFTYQNKKSFNRIKKFADKFQSDIVLYCDVSKDDNINSMFNELSKFWTNFDGFVHSIAYVDKNQLFGNYIDVINKNDFNISHEISSYSFVAMAKSCKDMLNKNSALLTLTYIGSKKVIPNYNVMGLAKASLETNTKYMAFSLGPFGIRVNAISPGPIYTLSSSSIGNFKKMFSYYNKIKPLSKKVTIEDVGNVAAFLCSDLASGITGEIIHVDGGFNILGTGGDLNNF